MTVAALFVEPAGVYSGREGVVLWGVEQDARTYPGPHPVVAHPPCQRWGRYWSGGPSARVRRLKGDDGGCFASALHSVRMWGGVLEHPADSSAWAWHGLMTPHTGGWSHADSHGWTCHVEQVWYGHEAKKATWLYAVGCTLPSLRWGSAPIGAGVRPEDIARGRDRAVKTGVIQRLSKRQRAATPEAFAEMLIALARSAA